MTRTHYLGIAGLALVLGGLGFYVWIGGDFTAWYRLRQLAGATEETRRERAERVADLGPRALPGLLGLLRANDEATCQNARAALDRLLQGQADAPSLPEQIDTLARHFPTLSAAGQVHLLKAALGYRPQGQAPTSEETLAWTRVLAQIGSESPEEVRAAGLETIDRLLTAAPPEAVLTVVRSLVKGCLSASAMNLRLRATELSLRPGLELEAEVAALLRDPAPEVRRAALVVVGPAEKAVLDELLLPCLRDADADVQRLAEAALLSRGLTPRLLKLARLATDPNPLERLKVLDQLENSADLEPGVWLRRLSHDPADSVRATTVRVMAQQQQVDLRDRLEEMRRQDPSPTISQLAGFYLSQPRQ